ncbi:MAG: VOC family protein [Phycisphaerales bacterium]|nr:VOC family protein [Phycisphaerales bacterium]
MASGPIFILYVRDQERSMAFYAATLNAQPTLHVPGMSEFTLPGGAALGLMPEAGISRLIPAIDPTAANGAPRAELYLRVDDPTSSLDRAIQAGATMLSPVTPRDWGEDVAYCLDPDGHVLAFARPTARAPSGRRE